MTVLSAEAMPAWSQDKNQLEEIVVTAQRRSENLQKVPLSVSAFDSDTLTRAGISTVRDIQFVDPALNISAASGSVLPFLRGVGNPSATAIGNEASVPIYIDDIYYTRISPLYLEIAQAAIERVEVLKGPQGTLFGRNASGGLIHMITRDPSFDRVHLSAKLGYANYQTASGELYISGPISDKVAADISVAGLNQFDGWGRNTVTGKDTYKQGFISVRSKVVAQLTDTLRIRLIGFFGQQRSGQTTVSHFYRGTVGGLPPLYTTPLRPFSDINGRWYDTRNNLEQNDFFKTEGGSLKIDQELAFADLVSITSYRHATESFLVDADYSPVNLLNYKLPSLDREITQELQLKSKAGSPLDWVAGAFYLDSTQGYTPTAVGGDAITGGYGSGLDLIYGTQRIHSYSGYAQATAHVDSISTNVTLGLRYSEDKVHGTGRQELTSLAFQDPAGPIPDSSQNFIFEHYDKEFTFKQWTYKVAVDHQFAEGVMGYASASRGYKSGTFNTLPLNADPAKSEVVDSYEVGVKTDLLNRRLRFNLAVFQNDIKNPQVQTIISNGISNFVGLANAEKARVRGVELDINALLTQGLTARLGATLLDPRYVKFLNAPQRLPVVDAAGNPIPPFGTQGGLPTLIDASGRTLAQVARIRFTGGLDYEKETMVGKFNFDANVSFTGAFSWDPDGVARQKEVTLVNGSIEYRPKGRESISIRVWGKNLTDERYYSSELPVGGPPGNIGLVAPPRTYGVELGYTF